MKQGHADRSGAAGQKVEPKSHGVNPGWAGQFGSAVDPKAAEPKHKDRGYKAPKNDSHSSTNCGSQGRF